MINTVQSRRASVPLTGQPRLDPDSTTIATRLEHNARGALTRGWGLKHDSAAGAVLETLRPYRARSAIADSITIAQPADRHARMADRMTLTLTLVHPKGGVGRSTTAYMLGVELALRGHRVALIDRDQGRHLSRLLEFYPCGVDSLELGDRAGADVDVRIIDTAPEMDFGRTMGYLREADWVIVPVKGPEAGSVLALPLLLDWLDQAQGARLLGFLPTMYKVRRAEARRWLAQLQQIAAERRVPVFPPIRDLAALAAYRLDGHPYGPVADAVEEVLRGARV